MRSLLVLPILAAALAGCAAPDDSPRRFDDHPRVLPDVRGPIAATVAPAAAPAEGPDREIARGEALPADEPVAEPALDAEPAAAPEAEPAAVEEAEPAAVEDDPAPPPPAPVPPPAPEDSPSPPPRDAAAKEPPPAPPDGAAVVAKDPVADAKARAIVERAAALQNAGDLADPAKVQSFRVLFHKATFESEKRAADGTTTRRLIETDTGGLVFLWKRHTPPRDGAPADAAGSASLRTEITVDGQTTTKAWYEPRRVGWIDDGKSVASLLGPDRAADLDQLQFQRRLIGRLLDVAILAKLLRDGSTFRIVADAPPHPGTVGVERIPPADAPQAARLILWIAKTGEEEYGDVVGARMPPTAETAGTLDYKFVYHPQFPVVKVETAEGGPKVARLRFPFGVTVHEQLPDETRPRKVLEVNTASVEVNSVTDEAFAQPRRR